MLGKRFNRGILSWIDFVVTLQVLPLVKQHADTLLNIISRRTSHSSTQSHASSEFSASVPEFSADPSSRKKPKLRKIWDSSLLGPFCNVMWTNLQHVVCWNKFCHGWKNWKWHNSGCRNHPNVVNVSEMKVLKCYKISFVVNSSLLTDNIKLHF